MNMLKDLKATVSILRECPYFVRVALEASCIAMIGLCLVQNAPAQDDDGLQDSQGSAAQESLFAAARDGDLAQVKQLIESGIDVNSVSSYGATSLMFACSRGQTEVVQYLLDQGADPNAKDTFYSATAMAWAAMKRHSDVGLLLLRAGSEEKEAALRLAVLTENVAVVDEIMSKFKPALGALQRLKKLPSVGSNEKLAELFADVPDAEDKAADSTTSGESEADWSPSSAELESYVGSYAEVPSSQEAREKFERAMAEQDESELVLAEVVVDLQNLNFRKAGSSATLTPMEKHRFKFAESVFIFEIEDGQAVGLRVESDGQLRSRFVPFLRDQKSLQRVVLEEGLAVSSPDWPQFRGVGARGVAEGQNPPVHWDVPDGRGVLWQKDVEGLAHSSPIIVGDRLFITTAISEKDQAGLRTGLYGDVDSVDDDSEHRFEMHCYDKKTGELLWKHLACHAQPAVKRHLKGTHANPTPASDGRRVVAFFGSEGLYCYSVEGELLWQRDLGKMDSGWFFDPSYQWGFASSPIIYEDMVFIQADIQKGSFLAAFDLETGDELWRKERDEIPSWSTPSVLVTEAGPQLVTNATNFARAYDPSSGEEIWRLGKNSEIVVPTPFLAHGLIYITSGYRPIKPLLAIRPSAKGDISLELDSDSSEFVAWSNRRSGPYMTTPVVYGNYLYTCNSAGILECLDAETGERAYRKRIATSEATSFIAALLAADGHIYLASEEGVTLVVKAGPKYELVAQNRMGDTMHATPAISEGVMYLRGGSKLVAVGTLKAAGSLPK